MQTFRWNNTSVAAGGKASVVGTSTINYLNARSSLNLEELCRLPPKCLDWVGVVDSGSSDRRRPWTAGAGIVHTDELYPPIIRLTRGLGQQRQMGSVWSRPS